MERKAVVLRMKGLLHRTSFMFCDGGSSSRRKIVVKILLLDGDIVFPLAIQLWIINSFLDTILFSQSV